jgi:hypothetical protein
MSPLDESALDDESDDDTVPVHTSAIRRFSRRQSQNAEPIEVAGILSTRERRASRRDSQPQATKDTELLHRRGPATPQTLERQLPGAGSSTSNLNLEASTSGLQLPASVSNIGMRLGNTSTSSVNLADNKQEPAFSSTSIPSSLAPAPGLPSRRLSRTAQIIAEERGVSASGSTSYGIVLPDPALGLMRTDTIKEVDTTPPTPAVELELSTFEVQEAVEDPDPRATGKIASWRGATILVGVSFKLCVRTYGPPSPFFLSP